MPEELRKEQLWRGNTALHTAYGSSLQGYCRNRNRTRVIVRAFRAVPGLFCATAQILFPAGVRREETGKAVMAQEDPDDFPIRCDEPLAGEDGSYALYGSGGASLYDGAKLRALGGWMRPTPQPTSRISTSVTAPGSAAGRRST